MNYSVNNPCVARKWSIMWWMVPKYSTFITIFFPKFVMSKNFSIGICQIKPNTALKVGLKIKDKNKLIQMLMLPKLNIHVCAKILAAVKNESIQNQILFYTTGTKELLYFFCPEVILYYHLCSISTKNKNFDF